MAKSLISKSLAVLLLLGRENAKAIQLNAEAMTDLEVASESIAQLSLEDRESFEDIEFDGF